MAKSLVLTPKRRRKSFSTTTAIQKEKVARLNENSAPVAIKITKRRNTIAPTLLQYGGSPRIIPKEDDRSKNVENAHCAQTDAPQTSARIGEPNKKISSTLNGLRLTVTTVNEPVNRTDQTNIVPNAPSIASKSSQKDLKDSGK